MEKSSLFDQTNTENCYGGLLGGLASEQAVTDAMTKCIKRCSKTFGSNHNDNTDSLGERIATWIGDGVFHETK